MESEVANHFFEYVLMCVEWAVHSKYFLTANRDFSLHFTKFFYGG